MPVLASSQPSEQPSDTPIKKLRQFSASDDVALLREALDERPWEAAHGFILSTWEAVAGRLTATFNRDITADAAQKRFNKLLEHFRKEEMDSLRKSGFHARLTHFQ
jgi:hypothetical protein